MAGQRPLKRAVPSRPLIVGLGLVLSLMAGCWLLFRFELITLPGLVQAEEQLTVGVYDNPPKIYVDGDGEPAGLFATLLMALAREQGWELEFQHCEWGECLEAVEAGELDLMPDVAPSPERRARFSFHSVPVAQGWSQIYAPLGNDFRSLEDLDGARIGLLEASVQESQLAELAADLGLIVELVAFSSFEEAFEAVQTGLVDAVASNQFYGFRHASAFRLVETPISFGQTSLHYVAPRGEHDSILEQIDRQLAEWKSDPESPYFTALSETINPPSETVLPGWLLPSALGTMAIVLALLAHGWFLHWRVRLRTHDLQEANQRLKHVLDSSPVILYSSTPSSEGIDWVSSNIERILSISPEAAQQPGAWEERIHPDDSHRVHKHNLLIGKEDNLVQEYRLVDARGKTRFIRDEKRLIRHPKTNQAERIIGSWTDLTASHEQQERLKYLANYDIKTGLPNRHLLEDRLARMVHHARERHHQLMIVFLDLDRFKHINETLGAPHGDAILKEAAARLLGLTHKRDTVARIGSDEFCILMEAPDTLEDRHAFMGELVEAFRAPLSANGQPLVLTISAGYAVYPIDSDTAEDLMAAGELSLEAAKRSGGDGWRAFEPGMVSQSDRRLFLERDLRTAIEHDQFLLHFQPKFALASGELVGLEALVRWQHPQRGMIPPGDFIPLAEETGLIRQIDRWVLGAVCRQIKAWDRSEQAVERVAINISAMEFKDHDLAALIKTELDRNNLSAERLTIEVTETMLMDDPEQSRDVLAELSDMGVKIAMDDFGTGYSNLAYVWQLPLNEIKVDQSLIRDIENSRHARSIIRAIIALAQTLELDIVAEGIETRAQLDFLRKEGCTIGQGFLLGRPTAEPAFQCAPESPIKV